MSGTMIVLTVGISWLAAAVLLGLTVGRAIRIRDAWGTHAEFGLPGLLGADAAVYSRYR